MYKEGKSDRVPYVKPAITKLGKLTQFIATSNQGGAIDGSVYEEPPGSMNWVHPTGPKSG